MGACVSVQLWVADKVLPCDGGHDGNLPVSPLSLPQPEGRSGRAMMSVGTVPSLAVKVSAFKAGKQGPVVEVPH
jgi:hypothetical protein